MVKVCRCPDIVRERGIMEAYGDWPIGGVPETSMKNVRINRKRRVRVEVNVDTVEDLEDEQFEDVV